MKVAAFFYSEGRNYRKWGDAAVKTFKVFHPDIDVVYVNEDNFSTFEMYEKFRNYHPSIKRFGIAYEVMKSQSIDKLMMFGVDVIACSHYKELLISTADIAATYDFYGTHKVEYLPMTAEKYCNSDIVCFNSVDALGEVVKKSINPLYAAQYREQHALNEEILTGRWTVEYVEDHGVFYNLRALAKDEIHHHNINTQIQKYVTKWYVMNNKLYHPTGKEIRSFHFGDTIEKHSDFDDVILKWKSSILNSETVEFLSNICGAVEIFDV